MMTTHEVLQQIDEGDESSARLITASRDAIEANVLATSLRGYRDFAHEMRTYAMACRQGSDRLMLGVISGMWRQTAEDIVREEFALDVEEAEDALATLTESTLPQHVNDSLQELLSESYEQSWTTVQFIENLDAALDIPEGDLLQLAAALPSMVKFVRPPVLIAGLARMIGTRVTARRVLRKIRKQSEKVHVTRGKRWVTMEDDRVRDAHREASGQVVRLSDKFWVAGHLMDFPGDPSAPIALTINCRCVVIAARIKSLPE